MMNKRDEVLHAALDELKTLIEKELGGMVEKHILTKDCPEVAIAE